MPGKVLIGGTEDTPPFISEVLLSVVHGVKESLYFSLLSCSHSLFSTVTTSGKSSLMFYIALYSRVLVISF